MEEQQLALAEVEGEVIKVLQLLPSYFPALLHTGIHHSKFVNLSEKELTEFGTIVNISDKCRQVCTSRSVVITERHKFAL